MPFFRRKSSSFIDEAGHSANKARQVQGVPSVMSQLRKLGVTDQSSLKLEFFFYTNAGDKAAGLADALRDLQYEVRHGTGAGKTNQFVVTGWTQPIRMT